LLPMEADYAKEQPKGQSLGIHLVYLRL